MVEYSDAEPNDLTFYLPGRIVCPCRVVLQSSYRVNHQTLYPTIKSVLLVIKASVNQKFWKIESAVTFKL